MSYRNCFQNNCQVTINSMFNDCLAVHSHLNALQVILVNGVAARITCSCWFLSANRHGSPGLVPDTVVDGMSNLGNTWRFPCHREYGKSALS